MNEENFSPIASDEKIDAIIEILRFVGLQLEREFRDHFKDRENWEFSAFEWTEQTRGVRYFFSLNREGKLSSGVILEIGWTPYSADQIEESNRKLAELLAD